HLNRRWFSRLGMRQNANSKSCKHEVSGHRILLTNGTDHRAAANDSPLEKAGHRRSGASYGYPSLIA
ncbi:hypothetical protein, partial [Rhodopirellula halodulae]|uniref:hypothetical protein n=1 Tax=Rhodopirellula halodulae TaxID=2894198 RepID=UPI001E30C04C